MSMVYTDEEIKNLWDSLESITVGQGPIKVAVYLHTGYLYVPNVKTGYLYVPNVKALGKLINLIEIVGDDTILKTRSEKIIKEMCHDTPVEDMPLHTNDEPNGHLAQWRLKIAK